jgi:hypothetical protein
MAIVTTEELRPPVDDFDYTTGSSMVMLGIALVAFAILTPFTLVARFKTSLLPSTGLNWLRVSVFLYMIGTILALVRNNKDDAIKEGQDRIETVSFGKFEMRQYRLEAAEAFILVQAFISLVTALMFWASALRHTGGNVASSKRTVQAIVIYALFVLPMGVNIAIIATWAARLNFDHLFTVSCEVTDPNAPKLAVENWSFEIPAAYKVTLILVFTLALLMTLITTGLVGYMVSIRKHSQFHVLGWFLGASFLVFSQALYSVTSAAIFDLGMFVGKGDEISLEDQQESVGNVGTLFMLFIPAAACLLVLIGLGKSSGAQVDKSSQVEGDIPIQDQPYGPHSNVYHGKTDNV